jgi:hypothetical protein
VRAVLKRITDHRGTSLHPPVPRRDLVDALRAVRAEARNSRN